MVWPVLGALGVERGKKWVSGCDERDLGSEVKAPTVGRGLPRVKGRTLICGQERVLGQGRKRHYREKATLGQSRSSHCGEWETLNWNGREIPGRGGRGTTLRREDPRVRDGSRPVGKKGNPSLGGKVQPLVGRWTPGSEVRDVTVERCTWG